MTYFAPKIERQSTKLDSAETFAESDVSASLSGTAVESGSIKLAKVTGTTATRDPDNSSNGDSKDRGLKINPNTGLEGVRVTVSSNTGEFSVAVLTDSSENILASTTGPHSAGDTIDLEASLSAGTTYHVVAYDDGNSFTYGYDNGPAYPYGSTDVDIMDGVFAAHPDDGQSVSTTAAAPCFSDVTAIESLRTSGSATVEWPQPADLYAWDTAVFQSTPDGETVDVYIEEDQSSGWTEIAGPIARGASIDADPSNNVRYRIELSRSSTSNNPTLDAIYRRIKL
jgi:hypothetical protein